MEYVGVRNCRRNNSSDGLLSPTAVWRDKVQVFKKYHMFCAQNGKDLYYWQSWDCCSRGRIAFTIEDVDGGNHCRCKCTVCSFYYITDMQGSTLSPYCNCGLAIRISSFRNESEHFSCWWTYKWFIAKKTFQRPAAAGLVSDDQLQCIVAKGYDFCLFV